MIQTPSANPAGPATHTAKLVERRWLSPKTFEIELTRPQPFTFMPGQYIRLGCDNIERDYSLVSAPGDDTIRLCIRHRRQGGMSDLLAAAEPGRRFHFSGPAGYFTFRFSDRPAVFVATGTGIAPFVSMVRTGLKGFYLLHGVQQPSELYYRPLFESKGPSYVPCLSGKVSAVEAPENAFLGLVTGCLEQRFRQQPYDFYLCGRKEMIRDVTLLADDIFPGSHVYTEIFY